MSLLKRPLSRVVALTRPDVAPQPTALSFKINNFDLIRLFAALQVAVFHAYDRLELGVPAVLAPLGWFPGVPIFFVISGFLISAAFERNAELVPYARNRMLRIYPGLWACLLVTVVVAIAFGFSFASPNAAFWLVLQMAGVIFTPAFLADFGDGTYNGSLWTIPLELQFYAILPVAYWLTRRSVDRTRDLIALFLVFLAIGCAVKLALPAIATPDESGGAKLLRYSFIPRVYLFLLGVVLQRLRVHASPYVRGRALHWLAGFVVVRLLLPQDGLVYVFNELILGVTVIAFAYSAPTVSERLLRGNDISYGVYLYHGLVLNILIELAIPGSGALAALVLLAAGVLGGLSWMIVERPAIRRKLRRAPALNAASSAP